MTGLANQVLAAILALVIILGPLTAAAIVLMRRKRSDRRRRRSPLTAGLLRTPGHSLREQLEEDRFKLDLGLAVLMFAPALVMAVLFAQATLTGQQMPLAVLALVLLGIVVFAVSQINKLHRIAAEMDNRRLGLDAELAVGQELDQLMREGAAVFHDLPAEKFNVDHVVIAPQGVFAVETKGNAKPNRGKGAADAKLIFDGQRVIFPDRSSSQPVEQAERQARWLSQWLTKATGAPVAAIPVLAFPGWFVERKGRGEVRVFSGKELRNHLLTIRTGPPLSPEQMRRVIHQVEQRCRAVEPTYRPEDA